MRTKVEMLPPLKGNILNRTQSIEQECALLSSVAVSWLIRKALFGISFHQTSQKLPGYNHRLALYHAFKPIRDVARIFVRREKVRCMVCIVSMIIPGNSGVGKPRPVVKRVTMTPRAVTEEKANNHSGIRTELMADLRPVRLKSSRQMRRASLLSRLSTHARHTTTPSMNEN